MTLCQVVVEGKSTVVGTPDLKVVPLIGDRVVVNGVRYGVVHREFGGDVDVRLIVREVAEPLPP
jgi:hypothetical protein